MPKKSRKSKSTDPDLPDLETRRIILQSIGMPSPYRGGSTTTSSTDDSSSSCTTAESEDSSNKAESKKPADSGTLSSFECISESGAPCDNEATKNICQQQGDETDIRERPNPSDVASNRDCQLISEDGSIERQKESEPLLDSEPTSKAVKEDKICEEISLAAEASQFENMEKQLKSPEGSAVQISHAIKNEVVFEEIIAAETSYEENITQEEKSVELMDSGNIFESSSNTADSTRASSEVRFVVTSNSQIVTSTMSTQATGDRTFKRFPHALKETQDHENNDHNKDSREQTKDLLRTTPEKATPHRKINDKPPKSKERQFRGQATEVISINPDDKEKATHVKSDSCSFLKNHPKHEGVGEGTEPRPKCVLGASSQEKFKADSQTTPATWSSEKGNERTGVSFKHTTEISPGEQERKKAKTTSTGVRPKVSPRKYIGASSKRRTQSEPTSKIKSDLPANQRIDMQQPKRSLGVKEKHDGMGQRQHYTLDVPHRKSRARTSSTAKPERDEIITRSKSSLEVSPRKRKSESTTSCSGKVQEGVPPKRAQRSSSVVSTTPRRSSGGNRTSPRVQRRRTLSYRYRSKSWTSTRMPCKSLTTNTECIKEILLFKGMSELPTISSRPSCSQAYTSRDESLHVSSPTEDTIESISEESSSSTSRESRPQNRVAQRKELGIERPAIQSARTKEAGYSIAFSSKESRNERVSQYNQEGSEICKGARPKILIRNTKKISPQKGLIKRGTGSKSTSKNSPEKPQIVSKNFTSSFAKEDGKKECPTEYENGSSSSNDAEIHDLSQDTTCRNKLVSFEEFKETLGVDKMGSPDLSLDVFDKALGIDRSGDHSVPENRQPIKMITQEEFLETLDHDYGRDPSRVPPADSKTRVSESPPQSIHLENRLVTFEEFRNALRPGQTPPTIEKITQIFDEALQRMDKSPRASLSVSESRRRTSPEREMDEAPFQDVLFRPNIHQSRSTVRDCFDFKGIENALDEVQRSERTSNEGTVCNDPCQSKMLEDSEESNEDINRIIVESGMKIKRSQVILSDDDLASSGRSDSVEEAGLAFENSELRAEGVTDQIQGKDISETSQSSRESPEDHSRKSSDRDEASSESPVEVAEYSKKLSNPDKNVGRSRISVVPSLSGKQLGWETLKNEKSSRQHDSESSEESNSASPKKRQRTEHTRKNPVSRRRRNRRKSESDLRKRRPSNKEIIPKKKRHSGEFH